MIDWAADSMRAWAAARGLEFREQDLLPPVTAALDVGFGVGDHRSGLVRSDTRRSVTSTGGFTRRPERSTWNLCAGVLPGGAEGAVAHHVALVERYGPSSEGGWYAVPDTVVLVRVPEAVRVTRTLRAEPAPAAPKVLIGGPIATTVAPGTFDIGGWRWRADRDVERLELDVDAGGLPDRTSIDLRDGALSVSARGVFDDPATLDRLCRVASAVADGLRRQAAAQPGLAGPLPGAVLDPRALELVAAAGSAPAFASVADARAAAAERMPRRRRRRTDGAGSTAAGNAAVDGIGGGLVGAAISGLATLAVLAPGRRRREDDPDLGPVALDAFAASYAAQRGLVVEDRDAVRRALAVPFAGVPLRVWRSPHGGRLAFWIDGGDRSDRRYAVVAILPPPAGGSDHIVHWRAITDAERTAATLDAAADAATAA